MQVQSDLREEIKREFPPFQEKTQLQPYYMSYEYPDRQQRLYELWKRLLVFVCRAQRRLTFSRDELS